MNGESMNLPVAVNPASLHLDLNNPRMPEASFKDDFEAIQFLASQAELSELVQSIGNSGWLDYEPLIVEKATSVVLEGNRRLAALRIISDTALQDRLRIRPPSTLHENATPTSILVYEVESRRDARDFIGFKHVNGAFKWDSYAKARFAASWIDEGDSIEDVSRRLGDGHNTVSRLVNGVRVLHQAEALGDFDREKISRRSFYFSHLYTGLSYHPVRDYLGLSENESFPLSKNPVPESKREELRRYLTWLYGQGDESAIIRSQNPDLNRLTSVLANVSATRVLEASNNLDQAYGMVEDPKIAFEKAFFKMIGAVEEVNRLIGRYDANSNLLKEIAVVRKSIEAIEHRIKSEHNTGDTGRDR